MSYLNYALEPGGNYFNKYTGIKLPNDAALKDPDKLAELSGPVHEYNLYEKGEKNADS